MTGRAATVGAAPARHIVLVVVLPRVALLSVVTVRLAIAVWLRHLVAVILAPFWLAVVVRVAVRLVARNGSVLQGEERHDDGEQRSGAEDMHCLVPLVVTHDHPVAGVGAVNPNFVNRDLGAILALRHRLIHRAARCVGRRGRQFQAEVG